MGKTCGKREGGQGRIKGEVGSRIWVRINGWVFMGQRLSGFPVSTLTSGKKALKVKSVQDEEETMRSKLSSTHGQATNLCLFQIKTLEGKE